MGPRPPTPTCAFAEHRTAIVDIVAHTGERVLSLDSDRVAYLWNPRTAELIARHELGAAAVLRSAFVTATGELAYVAYAGGTLSVRTFDADRVLAEVAAPGLAEIAMAACTADLSRVALSIESGVVVVQFAKGTPARHAGLRRCESHIESIHAAGSNFYVRHHYLAMALYPVDDRLLLDGETLEELAKDVEYSPLPPTSPFAAATVSAFFSIVRVKLGNGHLLPDLVAHKRNICLTRWNPHDNTLLTADDGGTIHRWVIELANLISAHHHGPVTRLRFTKDGVVSLTEQDARIWRDGTLVANVAISFVRSVLIDEETDRLLFVTDYEITTYSLRDGAHCAMHRVPSSEYMSTPVRSARGHTSVSFRQAYPVRVASVRDRTERILPEPLHEQLHYLTPIVHDGHLLISYFMPPFPLRVFALDTLAIVAERPLQVRWMALHPDGRTLYTAGVADGEIAAWAFPTLAERSRWTVIPGELVQPVAAVLLASREQIILATRTLLRRTQIAGGNYADCALDNGEIEALVGDAAETRIVAFMRDGTASVLDVDTMQWVEARSGELDAARSARRTWSKLPGFQSAFDCGDWRVGYSPAVSATAISLLDRPLRSFFLMHEVGHTLDVRAALVDDQRDELLLIERGGALRKTSLAHDAPLEPVSDIPGAERAAWLGPSMFAVFDTSGTMHVLRTTGERVCTIDGFLTGLDARFLVLSEHGVACPARDGVRLATIPDSSYVTLTDARMKVPPERVAIAPPFAASLHGNQVLRWDLRTKACTGAWEALTALSSVDVRVDGTVVTGDIGGTVTLLR
ncbi:MAG: hypothetical protein H0T46_34140 [Deltaproteobacteria bacterium]|nr:hypothetical protein [Deltaproteobacteria bacterium]